eukprot:318959-Prorocentrum_minimum.AAC.1
MALQFGVAVLEFGVIDILQAYNYRKKIEHICKSVEHKNSKTISSVDPVSYSNRFQKFMSDLFVPVMPVTERNHRSVGARDWTL